MLDSETVGAASQFPIFRVGFVAGGLATIMVFMDFSSGMSIVLLRKQ